ncbi:hypothetical protein L6452_06541 [Arctium lappa]|uniref:Uncharacterized protein n=1 Tax=Arctium lappa TaxID=4217 RepID=A0ACB9EK37_ARCLA|nr:hypothetical protein L6452_06541 [Arctium lappa]
MPSYVRFLKDILNKKRRLGEFEIVALAKECSALLTCKIPPKLKDSGCFTIPCSIGGQEVGHALCDLGASINLMPLSVFKKLGIGEVRPTTVTLQLADRSLAYPKGKIEDILVKVDKFIFTVDFLVLDYEADQDVPILLGRPFLATGRTLIDVQKGELTMRVNDQKVTFNVFKSFKLYGDLEDCSTINLLSEDLGLNIEECVEHFEEGSENERKLESPVKVQPPMKVNQGMKEVRMSHHKHKKKCFLSKDVPSPPVLSS